MDADARDGTLARRPRARSEPTVRATLAMLVALAVLGGAGYLVVEALGSDGPGGPDPLQRTVSEWTEAVETGDVAALTGLTADRVDLDEMVEQHEAFAAVVGDGSAEIRAEQASVDDNEADVGLQVDVRFDDGTRWSYRATLPLQRRRGEWQVAWRPSALHPELRPGWRLDRVTDTDARAPVLDRDDRTLSAVGGRVEIGIEAGRLPPPSRLLPAVDEVLPQAIGPLRDLLARDDLVEGWYYPVVQVDAEVAEEAWPRLNALPGMERRDLEEETAPAGSLAPLVGVTEERGDRRVGVSGLEEAFDERLSGTPPTRIVLRGPTGDVRQELATLRTDAGEPLRTTLDRAEQDAIELALGATADLAAVAAVDPADGGLVALSRRPRGGFLRGVAGTYPPGTAAGLVTAVAALQEGVDPSERLPCPQRAVVGGIRVRTGAGGAQPRPLGGALRPGCATGLAALGGELGPDALATAAADLGFGVDLRTGLDVADGSFPEPADTAEAAAAAIGHARVTTSVVHLASVAAAMEAGRWRAPVLLAEELDDPDRASGAVLPDATSAVLRSARAASVPGAVGVVGRTGLVAGDPAPPVGWWVGILAVEDPERALAVAVLVEGDDGSRATEIAREIAAER